MAVVALVHGQAVSATSATDLTTTEVVVTARKIQEDLQDVPMSVQVLSGEFVDESGSTRLHELQFAIPGLVINNTGMFGAGFALRGIADQRVGGLSVAPHVNGVYLGSSNVAVARLFDIERIEVLKGPQGTLYGRNATGGSINFITRPPEDTLGSAIEVSYGSFETARAQGHLNLPLSTSALRLAFVASDSDGYIRNSVDDRRFAEDDFWGLRGSVRFEPNDDLRLDIMAQHLRDDGGSGELWSPRPDFLVDPHDIRLTTVTLENPYLISEIDNLNVSLEYQLGFATLRSITGYAHSEVRNVDDCAGLPLLQGCTRSAQPIEFDQWSQEFQLVFPRSGAVEGIVGAYYSDAETVMAFYLLAPLVNTQPLSDNHSTLGDPAFALFGQATLHLSDEWSVTGGLRLGREEHTVSTIGTGFNDSPTLLVNTSESDDPSWRFDLSYAPSDSALLYLGISTGYKSGGFDSTSLISGEPDRYGPEYLTAFEAGAKSRWLSGRLTLNAAAFYYDYEDLQVNTATFQDDQVVFNIDNAAKAELYGIDAELDFLISQWWSVDGGVAWLPKRKFVEFRNEVTGDTLSGNDLVRAPEWTASVACEYARPAGDLGSLSMRMEYSYRSGFYYTPENDPLLAQDSFGLLNAYVKFEAPNEAWYAFVSGRNLTDEDYFTQVFLQSSPGYPDTYEVGFGYRF